MKVFYFTKSESVTINVQPYDGSWFHLCGVIQELLSRSVNGFAYFSQEKDEYTHSAWLRSNGDIFMEHYPVQR